MRRGLRTIPGRHSAPRSLQKLLPLAGLLLLTGCEGVLEPQGSVGEAERTLIYTSVCLMLLVVLPVIVLTLVFAFKFRASNKQARYMPDFHHSTPLELTIWGIPCVIILILAILTWNTTHSLDPYRKLDAGGKPVNIQVVAMDWKWLFIYPEEHVATVNQIAFPKGVPVNFTITSDAVMNSFFIPQLGTQIYAMAGMKTRLHLLASNPGKYDGLSANFSGDGFSDMHFQAIATPDEAGYQAWLQKVRSTGQTLNAQTLAQVERPSAKVPPAYFGTVDGDVFDGIIAKYMGKAMSMQSGMHSDMHPGMRPGMED